MGVSVPYPKAIESFPEIRQSLLSAFDACALETKFEIEYRHGWSTHPQARGQLFHRFAARALEAMNSMDEGQIEVDVALAILHEVLRQDDIDRECPECGTTEIEPGVDHGDRRCANGHLFETDLVNVPMAHVKDLYWIVKKWASENEFDIANLVDIEKRLVANVRYVVDGIGVERLLTGQLDALLVEGDYDDHAIVLDWKDTWGLPSPTDVSFEGYFQQRFYGWLVMRNYKPIEKVTLREYYVRRSVVREATIWREQLDDIEAELSALAERFDRSVEEGTWVPTPGKHCSYCPRPTACPIPRFARGEGRITDEKDASERARQLIVAQAIVKQNTEALAAWADQHGPIPIRDAKGVRVLGHRQAPRVSRPTQDELRAAIMQAGNVQSLDVDSLYKETKITRFEPHVPNGKETEEDAVNIAALEEALADAKARRAG